MLLKAIDETFSNNSTVRYNVGHPKHLTQERNLTPSLTNYWRQSHAEKRVKVTNFVLEGTG